MNAPLPVDLWDQVKERVRSHVGDQSFSTWFSPTAQESFSEGKLVVSVPNKFSRDWLNENFQVLIRETASAIAGRECAVIFKPVETKEPEERPRQDDLPFTKVLHHNGTVLNRKYTFDTFVVGSSNQMAQAASLAVAEGHSKTYNPLFLYGGAGLGKTHLLHAIGHRFLERNPGARVMYLNSETFTNEFINSIRYQRMPTFRQRYRNMDLLLIDDIQFIAGKEGTQEEFFHTFNSIHESHKQIVLTSDKVPRDIQDLEDRLRSRFEWGLIADIQSPDLETKVAILKKKAEAEAVPLPDAVAIYIAGRIKSNIRELEGSLIRLIAYASLTGRELSIELAQDVLRNVLEHEEKAVTIDSIQKFVSDYYQLKLAELKSRNNSKSVAMPRQVAMYLCKALTRASLPEIGRSFGGKHHSTVIHSIKKVEAMRKQDPNFNTLLNSFLEGFR